MNRNQVLESYRNSRISTAKAIKMLFGLGYDGPEIGTMINEVRGSEFKLHPIDMAGLHRYRDYEEAYIPHTATRRIKDPIKVES